MLAAMSVSAHVKWPPLPLSDLETPKQKDASVAPSSSGQPPQDVPTLSQEAEVDDRDEWSQASGCLFPVSRMGSRWVRHLKEEAKEQAWQTAPMLKTKAAVYMTAVMEYLVAGVVELAGIVVLQTAVLRGFPVQAAVPRGCTLQAVVPKDLQCRRLLQEDLHCRRLFQEDAQCTRLFQEDLHCRQPVPRRSTLQAAVPSGSALQTKMIYIAGGCSNEDLHCRLLFRED